MEEFRAFKLLALASLRGFNVNVHCFYGSMDTATAEGTDKWWLRAKGQGLPVEGFSAGHESMTAVIDAMVRRLKAHRRDQDAARLERERAKRSQTFTAEEAEQLSQCP